MLFLLFTPAVGFGGGSYDEFRVGSDGEERKEGTALLIVGFVNFIEGMRLGFGQREGWRRDGGREGR